MNIPTEVLLFILSCFLATISYFLNRILSQMNELMKSHNHLKTTVALNAQKISTLEKVSCR